MSPPQRVAVVSGGSRGLGQALVSQFVSDGWAVATFSRTASPFIEQCQSQDRAEERFLWDAVDAADGQRLRDWTAEVVRRFGRLDVLVNNMAVECDGLLSLARPEDIQRQIAVNLEATLLLTRACLRPMLAQQAGAIVNISSVNALEGHAGVAVYSATKAALHGLTRSLAAEVGPAGVRVNCVAPGYFDSAMSRHLNDDQRVRLVARTPLRRLAGVDDVVAAVQFLISPQAAFITGQILAVDGGLTC